MRLAVMYIWVSRDVGHMIDSGSRRVSTVRFGHIATKCPSKKEAPVCVYCAGHHKSSGCPDKPNPKCANCSSRVAPGVSCSHLYALSPDCPMMALQRNLVIEGTDLVSSKKL